MGANVGRDYQYAIGADAGSVEYLYDLGIIPPRQHFQKFSKYVTTGNLIERGMGFPIIEWYWAFLDSDSADTLRAIVPDDSGEVRVRSLDDDLDWHTWRAVMVWPQDAPDVEKNHRLKVSVLFKCLEQID